jgi:hypothetical protein
MPGMTWTATATSLQHADPHPVLPDDMLRYGHCCFRLFTGSSIAQWSALNMKLAVALLFEILQIR